MYSVERVNKVYNQGEQLTTALLNVSVDTFDTGLIGIVGESGSGKTTLLNLLAGFDNPTEGDIFFCGENMKDYSDEDWNSFYSEKVGFVFQDYNVIEQLTVYDNICLALDILDIGNEQKKEMMEEVLIKLGIFEIKDKQVNKLSGGQKQRVAIARAYVKKPQVILADEPTGNLDYTNSVKIFEMLKAISEDTLVMVVTHDRDMAYKYSDKIISLNDGEIDACHMVSNNGSEVTIHYGDDCQIIENYTELLTFINQHKDDKGEYTIRIKEIHTESEEKKKVQKKQFIKKRLSNRKIINLSGGILSNRIIRKILSAGIFIATTFLLMFFLNMAFYDESVVISEYLEKYSYDSVTVLQELNSIIDNRNDTETAYVTKDIKEKIKSISESTMFSQLSSMEFSTTDRTSGNFFDDSIGDVPIYTEGRILSDAALKNVYGIENMGKEEILITDKLAAALCLDDLNIGSTYYVNGKPVILIGIVNATDSMVIFSEKYIETLTEQKRNRGITVAGSLFKTKSLFEYANSSITVKGIEEVEYKDLVGIMPSSKEEVVVSYEYVREHMDILVDAEKETDIIGKQIYLKDLYDDEYNDAFSDEMNLSAYLGKKITIVGIAEFDEDMIIIEGAYEEVVRDYCDVFCYNRFGCYAEDWTSIISEIHKNSMKIVDKNMNEVYSIAQYKEILFKYIAMMLFVMLVVTVFLMISLIGYSIKDNGKIIGIMKAVGVNVKDIKKVFLISPLKIILATIVVAISLTFGLVWYINNEYMNSIKDMPYDILPISGAALIIATIITIILGVVSVIVPIKEMDKKTIIDNIRNI